MNISLLLHTKTGGRLLALLVVCACGLPSRGQQAKGPLQLADQYFAAGEYYTAAHLYEQYLHPAKKQTPVSRFPLNSKRRRGVVTIKNASRADILFKQAESYRLANYWHKAAITYKECREKSTGKYTEAVYWIAVCERSLGNYTVAEDGLKIFLTTAGISSEYKEAAEKELQTLHYIRQQLARPDSVLITTHKLNIPNSSEKGAFAPVHTGGNQFLISSTQTDSVQVNGVNPHHSRLYYATLNNDAVEQMIRVALPSASPIDNQGAAGISADGRHLYFSQWKKENGRTVASIYYSVKETGGWSSPVLLPLVNSTGTNSKQPFCTTDGNYLFFASDRAGGSGMFDIWYAPLNKDGTTGTPVNAGTTINTTGDEVAPFYHNSSTTLVFSSNGRQGMGGFDLFAAKGKEATWSLPENMGHPVNSSRDDIYFFAPEKTTLLSNAIFSSDRGTGCCLETYSITKAPKNKLLTGIVYDCRDNKPLANAVVALKDASGTIIKEVTTGADGKYLFDTVGDRYGEMTLAVSREMYKDSTSAVTIENINEADLLTDKLINTGICIERKLVIKPENVVTIYFDFDKSNLKPEAARKLDSVYNVLVEIPTATLQVSGYTDGMGSDEYNKVLSDKRAKAAADYLIKKGIDTGRITFESFGECCPVEMEIINGRDNADGRSKNRRALINITKD